MKKTILFLTTALMAAGANAAELNDLNTEKTALEELSPSSELPVPSAADNYAFGTSKGGGDRWYGADSRQARMRFNSYMYYAMPPGYRGSPSELLSDSQYRQVISEMVDLQLRHMYGAFTTHPGFVDNPGIPSGDYKVTLLSAEKAPEAGYAKIIYSYDDIVVFSSNLFSGGSSRIQFVLPKDPAAIYEKGFNSPSDEVNRCTDSHYNSAGDFWYFWNPYQDGCPLDGGDLVAVQTDLKPIPMTRDTYPDYARLGRGGELKVVYLVGVDEGFQSGDLGRMTFNDAFEYLTEAGFEAGVNQARKKNLYFNNGRQNVSVEMLLLNPDSASFAAEAVRGMKTADIFIYDGHSGLGGYLDPERLAADSGSSLNLPKDKYQIFVFQGCSTYAYYNSAFFRLKKSASDPKGTKNLDIITTGIGAAFDVGAAVDSTFIRSVTMGDRPSWQTIMRRISKAEGESTALSHVNGDEDNPDSPN